MPMARDLEELLKKNYTTFSKRQKAIADYILAHPDKASSMTAVRLGQAVDTSESTVVRFAAELGYEGYPQLQKALQESLRNRLSTVERIAITEESEPEETLLETVMNRDAENIRGTLQGVDKTIFQTCVREILAARNIYIIGVRSSAALASFLAFYFNMMLPNVRLVSTNAASEVFEQILRAGEGDVVIGISFPRYSRRTVKAMQYARARGARVIAITAGENSPIAASADLTLLAQSNMASFVDSLTAPMSVINGLIVAVGMRQKEEVARSFEHLEQLWDEYDVYEKNN